VKKVVSLVEPTIGVCQQLLSILNEKINKLHTVETKPMANNLKIKIQTP
jgi:hypothetical protein